MKFHFHY